MNKTIPEAIKFLREILPTAEHSPDTVCLAVPSTCLKTLSAEFSDTPIELGAQNIYSEKDGAFTGETSAEMAADAGATFTLIGHSERRHIFHESNRFIHDKIVRALEAKLAIVLCIGETQEEKNKGNTEEVLRNQLTEALSDIPANAMAEIAIAYEPVWAIGSGVAATPEVAQGCHAFCRKLLTEMYGDKTAKEVKILYGGSVQPDNIGKFLENSDIDGVLVGKASLSTELFAKIINFRKH